VFAQVGRQRVGETAHAARDDVDEVQVGRLAGAAVGADQAGAVGRESRPVVVAGADVDGAHEAAGHRQVTQRVLGAVVDDEHQGVPVGRPGRSVGVAVALPDPARRTGDDVEQADRLVLARPAAEGHQAAVGRPGRVARLQRLGAADRAQLAALGVGDEHHRVLAVRVALEGEQTAVGREARRPVVVPVVGERAQGGGAAVDRHDGRGLALAVVDRQGQRAAVGRQAEVGRRRELGRVG